MVDTFRLLTRTQTLAALVLSLCFFWLGTERAEAALRVVTSFPHDAAIVQAVGGSHVEVVSLAKASKDPHAIQPKPSMALVLNRADLLVTNGQDMDLAWLPIALSNARNPRILDGEPGNFDPSEGASLIPYSPDELQDTPFYALNLIGGAGKTGDGKAGLSRGNHHYWLDPANGVVVARNLARKLSELDPEHAAEFRTNADRFEKRLMERVAVWDAAMKPFAGTPVVSYHRDWTYLIHRHGLRLVGYVEPRETIPPSAGEVVKLIQRMKRENARLILTSPWQNQRIPGEIARQVGGTHLVLPSSVGSDVGVQDYLELFEAIYGKLIPALQGLRD
ncbi:Manganese ABC transporter substrate-binding lipoprotein precursor [compost metagenome]